MNVAVLLSTYNGGKYLEEQIDSILDQQLNGEICLIVRDDGSSDNTAEILNRYADRGRLKWSSGDNLGSAGSFLQLLKSNPGYDYYAFADQDDVWFKDKIQKAVDAIKNEGRPALYSSNAELVNEDLSDAGRPVHRHIPKTDMYTVSIEGGHLGCTMVFNRELAKIVQENPLPNKIIMHDHLMALLCTACGGYFVYDRFPTMYYRRHGGNVTEISNGVKGIITSRLNGLKKGKGPGIADQAYCALTEYSGYMTETAKKWLERVAEYKTTVFERVKLGLSRKTKYQSLSTAFTLRLGIILGNK